MNGTEKHTEYTVTFVDTGLSVEKLLRQRLLLSGGAVRGARWESRILLNGEPARLNAVPRAGDVIRFIPREDRPCYLPKPGAESLTPVYRDDAFMILDKPAPLACFSGPGQDGNSMENRLYTYLGSPQDFIFRPVNRLDKGTSGLMAAALTGAAQSLLMADLHTPRFIREYLAVTDGIPPEPVGIIDAPIGKVSPEGVKREIRPDGKPSVTRYRVVSASGNRALLRLRLETGRTHQIRVHLAHIGCPILGDYLYGSPLPELSGRFALHSAFLSFVHPYTRERISFDSPLPPELKKLSE